MWTHKLILWMCVRLDDTKKEKEKKNAEMTRRLFFFLYISNSRSPISGNRKRVLELGHSITYCIDVCGCVCVHLQSSSLQCWLAWEDESPPPRCWGSGQCEPPAVHNRSLVPAIEWFGHKLLTTSLLQIFLWRSLVIIA